MPDSVKKLLSKTGIESNLKLRPAWLLSHAGKQLEEAQDGLV